MRHRHGAADRRTVATAELCTCARRLSSKGDDDRTQTHRHRRWTECGWGSPVARRGPSAAIYAGPRVIASRSTGVVRLPLTAHIRHMTYATPRGQYCDDDHDRTIRCATGAEEAGCWPCDGRTSTSRLHADGAPYPPAIHPRADGAQGGAITAHSSDAAAGGSGSCRSSRPTGRGALSGLVFCTPAGGPHVA